MFTNLDPSTIFFLYVGLVVIGFAIWYYIIKAAVKEGTNDINEKLQRIIELLDSEKTESQP